MVHHCHAPGCETVVKRGFLMCPLHWRRVPTELRHDVYHAYDALPHNADGSCQKVSKEYIEVSRRAIRVASINAQGTM